MLLHVVSMREYLLVRGNTVLFSVKVILIPLLALDIEQEADDTTPSLQCLLLSLHKLLIRVFCFRRLDELKRQIIRHYIEDILLERALQAKPLVHEISLTHLTLSLAQVD